ncbi:hypothetical protein Btru_018702 [Bulinus truncatus]|nr:hypothetical protein Btru_018702 [Bulinus truncatus]
MEPTHRTKWNQHTEPNGTNIQNQMLPTYRTKWNQHTEPNGTNIQNQMEPTYRTKWNQHTEPNGTNIQNQMEPTYRTKWYQHTEPNGTNIQNQMVPTYRTKWNQHTEPNETQNNKKQLSKPECQEHGRGIREAGAHGTSNIGGTDDMAAVTESGILELTPKGKSELFPREMIRVSGCLKLSAEVPDAGRAVIPTADDPVVRHLQGVKQKKINQIKWR